MKLFLDDVRVPGDCVSYMYHRVGPLSTAYTAPDWLIVRDFNEFVAAVEAHAGDLSHVSFDHDLADTHYHETMYQGREEYEQYLLTVKERTGYDCAVFLKEYYEEMNEGLDEDETYPLPIILIHTMNPVGLERIKSVFK